MKKSVLAAVLFATPLVAQADTSAFTLAPATPVVQENSATMPETEINRAEPQRETPLNLQDRGDGRRYFAQGTWELLISAAGSSDADFDNGGIGVNVGVGYFIADGLEFGLRQNLTYASGDDNSSWNGSTRVAIDYHFDLDRWQPFIGANIGYIYGEDTNDTWAAGPEAGVKWFIKDEAFLYAIVEYQFYFESGDEADDNFDDGQWNYGVGVGFTF